MFDSPLRRAAALGGQRSGEAVGPSLYETPSSRARASAGSSLGRECEHPKPSLRPTELLELPQPCCVAPMLRMGRACALRRR